MCKEIFCVECLENVASKKVNLPETFDIRGESIDVDSTYYQCPNCGELMYDSETPSENLEEADAEYRVRKNILTAEEIIEVRSEERRVGKECRCRERRGREERKRK